MNDGDEMRVAELIALLAEGFRQSVTEATLLAYWMALQDLPFKSVKTAVTKAIRECKFMPTAAELRSMSGELSLAQRAATAFEAVSRATKSIGPYKSVNFDDPICNAVIRNLGGWQRLCEVESEEEFEKWIRKDFERVYILIAQQDRVAPERCQPLLGYFDTQNSGNGYGVRPPELVPVGLPAAPNWPKLEGPKEEKRPAVRLLPGLEDMGKIK